MMRSSRRRCSAPAPGCCSTSRFACSPGAGATRRRAPSRSGSAGRPSCMCMTFFAVGVATDFRYAYWAVLAGLTGAVAVAQSGQRRTDGAMNGRCQLKSKLVRRIGRCAFLSSPPASVRRSFMSSSDFISELQMFGDGSIFSYAVAAQDAWSFHWHNISGRLFTYVFAYIPAEACCRPDRNAKGGIVVYGLLFFSRPTAGPACDAGGRPHRRPHDFRLRLSFDRMPLPAGVRRADGNVDGACAYFGRRLQSAFAPRPICVARPPCSPDCWRLYSRTKAPSSSSRHPVRPFSARLARRHIYQSARRVFCRDGDLAHRQDHHTARRLYCRRSGSSRVQIHRHRKSCTARLSAAARGAGGLRSSGRPASTGRAGKSACLTQPWPAPPPSLSTGSGSTARFSPRHGTI